MINILNVKYFSFFLLMLIFSETTLISCIVTTYRKPPINLGNDRKEITFYRNSFAKEKHVEAKLKESIAKEFSDNNYKDYIILDQISTFNPSNKVVYTIKFFKSKEDKLVFIDKKERFVKLLQDNLKNIKVGMTYGELDSLFKISSSEKDSDYLISRSFGVILTSDKNKSDIRRVEEVIIEKYISLKIENNILKEWHVIEK